MNTSLPKGRQFNKYYQKHGKYLRLKGLQPKTIEAYKRAIDLEPNDFHFMRYVRCPDAGIECFGYGEVMVQVKVVPRVKQG